MIEKSGFGVAMQGSDPEVIKISNYVTTSNDQDGVAKVLKKILQ